MMIASNDAAITMSSNGWEQPYTNESMAVYQAHTPELEQISIN